MVPGALPGFFKGGLHSVKHRVPTRLSCPPPCHVYFKKGLTKGGRVMGTPEPPSAMSLGTILGSLQASS